MIRSGEDDVPSGSGAGRSRRLAVAAGGLRVPVRLRALVAARFAAGRASADEEPEPLAAGFVARAPARF
jgi:hypothetical protein